MGTKDDRLAEAEQDLRSATEEINRLLTEAEARALTINPGHQVSVYVETVADEELGYEEFGLRLGLRKVKDRWRLVQGVGPLDSPEDWDWMPLQECALEDRIRACTHMGKLFDELLEACEKRALEARAAAAALKGALSEFRRGG